MRVSIQHPRIIISTKGSFATAWYAIAGHCADIDFPVVPLSHEKYTTVGQAIGNRRAATKSGKLRAAVGKTTTFQEIFKPRALRSSVSRQSVRLCRSSATKKTLKKAENAAVNFESCGKIRPRTFFQACRMRARFPPRKIDELKGAEQFLH